MDYYQYKHLEIQRRLYHAKMKAQKDPEYLELDEKIKELENQRDELRRKLTEKYYKESIGS